MLSTANLMLSFLFADIVISFSIFISWLKMSDFKSMKEGRPYSHVKRVPLPSGRSLNLISRALEQNVGKLQLSLVLGCTRIILHDQDFLLKTGPHNFLNHFFFQMQATIWRVGTSSPPKHRQPQLHQLVQRLLLLMVGAVIEWQSCHSELCLRQVWLFIILEVQMYYPGFFHYFLLHTLLFILCCQTSLYLSECQYQCFPLRGP